MGTWDIVKMIGGFSVGLIGGYSLKWYWDRGVRAELKAQVAAIQENNRALIDILRKREAFKEESAPEQVSIPS